MFTKEQLIDIGAEKLAEMILSLCKKNPDTQKQSEIMFAGFDSDPKKISSLIKEEIESLKCSTFRDYEDNRLADKIDKVVVHIMEDVLPKSPDQAIELLLDLLDSHKVFMNKVDDSCYTVGQAFISVCAYLAEAYEKATNSIEDVVDIVYNFYMNNDYSVCNEIIKDFKDILADNGLSLLKQKLEKSLDEKNTRTVQLGLIDIADCQNDVDAYIKACSLNGKPGSSDHLEIAERLIKHRRGIEAVQWLDSIDITFSLHQDKYQALKIQALDLYSDHKAAQTERLNWFETTLSPKIYSEILKYAEVDFIKSFKKTAIQKALDFPNPHAALTFLTEIQEFEQAAKLVRLKFDTLDGKKYYALRPLADVLCKIDPLGATLLYRQMIQPFLMDPKPYYYNDAAKDLANCHKLSSTIADWQEYQNHQLYFQEVSRHLKRKDNFWWKYNSALRKRPKRS